jgi:hypothetical protein
MVAVEAFKVKLERGNVQELLIIDTFDIPALN